MRRRVFVRPEWLGGEHAFCLPHASATKDPSRGDPYKPRACPQKPAASFRTLRAIARLSGDRSLSFSAARGAIARPLFLRYADSCLLCSPPSISRPPFALLRRFLFRPSRVTNHFARVAALNLLPGT